MKRSQVKEASLLDWSLELVMTVPAEVKILSVEVDWSEIQRVWDPWAGTGVIGKVLKAANPHISVMNNDWNVHLDWKEARDALQPGRRCMWVMVFKNSMLRAKMLSKGEQQWAGMCTAISSGKFANNLYVTDCTAAAESA
ncbi:hypothetical protein CYMTET_31216 [Cymbomonas tetramitiformis]|uniref:Methyltransferase n=1 Tax=Cymbomonas tetramitiformis TaxID=36881 RepID=A0AAE0FHV6_9CHLO|nr:hypothetical protein CYMTET_31216 [Cymbomonas tetramitiformis]